MPAQTKLMPELRQLEDRLGLNRSRCCACSGSSTATRSRRSARAREAAAAESPWFRAAGTACDRWRRGCRGGVLSTRANRRSAGTCSTGWPTSRVIPDGPFAGEPLVLTQEQAQFVLDYYVIDPVTGKRRAPRRSPASKGWGKSPILGRGVDRGGPSATSFRTALGCESGESRSAGRGRRSATRRPGPSRRCPRTRWRTPGKPVLDMVRSGPCARPLRHHPDGTFISPPRRRADRVRHQLGDVARGRLTIFAVFTRRRSLARGNGGVKPRRRSGAT